MNYQLTNIANYTASFSSVQKDAQYNHFTLYTLSSSIF